MGERKQPTAVPSDQVKPVPPPAPPGVSRRAAVTPGDLSAGIGRLQATAIRLRTADVAQLEEAASQLDWAISEIHRLTARASASAGLACIGCGVDDDGAYSFAEDHPSSIDVGPFCSQCFDGIRELVVRWHDRWRREFGAQATAAAEPAPAAPAPPPNRVIREGDRGPRS